MIINGDNKGIESNKNGIEKIRIKKLDKSTKDLSKIIINNGIITVDNINIEKNSIMILFFFAAVSFSFVLNTNQSPLIESIHEIIHSHLDLNYQIELSKSFKSVKKPAAWTNNNKPITAMAAAAIVPPEPNTAIMVIIREAPKINISHKLKTFGIASAKLYMKFKKYPTIFNENDTTSIFPSANKEN